MKNANSKASFMELINSKNYRSNLKSIIQLIRTNGPLSRRQISKLTGIYYCSIPAYVIRLKRDGLIEEVNTSICSTTGRRVGLLTCIRTSYR